MQILLLGSGTVTSRLSLALVEQGHLVVAQMAAFTPQFLDLFDFRAVLVVAPESSAAPESLTRACERGKIVFIVAGVEDGLAAWANAAGLDAFAYPPSEVEITRMMTALQRLEAGATAADEQYRRTVLGSDLAARVQSGMAVRKIAVTSPKGGTGKTTVAVNLAVALALSGISTYLVDADGNAGALQYHLRLHSVKTTMIGLLRRELARSREPLGALAAGAAYLDAFTPVDGLPTLKILPGLVTDDLGDEALQHEERVGQIIGGLYEAGVSAGGVVILDVGINPAHVVHRAALSLSEGIAIVIKPEVPDLAETRHWISRMIASLSDRVGRAAAFEFIGSRVKLGYNQVIGDQFKAAHRMLQQALQEDKLDIPLSPNGILPLVDPTLAAQAINSERREDILVWRYKREKLEELQPFTQALVGYASHFVPAVQEGATRAGLLNGQSARRFRLFGR